MEVATSREIFAIQLLSRYLLEEVLLRLLHLVAYHFLLILLKCVLGELLELICRHLLLLVERSALVKVLGEAWLLPNEARLDTVLLLRVSLKLALDSRQTARA